jgi:hypothetical protein
MVGVESMTVAINPADNSLIVVIERPLWMQQTKRDRCSRQSATVRKYLRIAARVPATIVSVRNIVTDRCSGGIEQIRLKASRNLATQASLTL